MQDLTMFHLPIDKCIQTLQHLEELQPRDLVPSVSDDGNVRVGAIFLECVVGDRPAGVVADPVDDSEI